MYRNLTFQCIPIRDIALQHMYMYCIAIRHPNLLYFAVLHGTLPQVTLPYNTTPYISTGRTYTDNVYTVCIYIYIYMYRFYTKDNTIDACVRTFKQENWNRAEVLEHCK